jgi:NAD(P)-dependent dehydrogenase (short-subunit alcohol dehydrogenase family)
MSDDRQWALVLGNTSGTGLAVSRSLAQEPGLHIFGMHRGNHAEGAAEVRRDVEALDRRYEELVGEAGKQALIDEALDRIAEVVGPRSIQIFVHSIANASIGYLASGPKLLHHKQIDKTFNSMAHSFVYWTRGLVERDLLVDGGRILALTNAIKESTLSNLSVIAAAKAALEMYVKYLAWELGPKGYKVNALKFGTVESAALRWIFPDEIWKEVNETHHRMHCAGRMGTVEEVGDFVSVLAGDRGAWFNGAVIDFTGGQMNSVYQLLMDVVEEKARS